MKPYILNFSKLDFASTAGSIWRTPKIDLYNNTQYKNYSVRRSNYGSDILNNGIYTGQATPTSEIGVIESDRFIDYSGRIDITTWSVDIETIGTATGTAIYTLNVYHSTEASADVTVPSDWVTLPNRRETDDLYVIDAGRYAYFELEFETDVNLNNFEIALNILIEINPPVVSAFFPSTNELTERFPTWMDMNERDPQNPHYLNVATPTSLGGKVLNAIAGEWLTDLRGKIDYQQAQYFIETVDTSQKAWAYRASGIPGTLTSIQGDGIQLARTSSIAEFNESQPGDHACFWNRSSRELYVNVNYTNLTINGDQATPTVLTLTPFHVWNSIDDIGTTVDLFRLELEENLIFKKRIMDVYRNKPGTSKHAFQNALRRELDLWSFEGATPSSDYQGATPNVYEIADLEIDPQYYTVGGMPTQDFKTLVDNLAKKYPITWGYFTTGKSFWDPDGTSREGFGYLPRQYDATPVSTNYSDSGVGDGNDLYLFRPDSITDIVQFNTKLRIKGRQRTNRLEYLPLEFDVAVFGRADQTVYNNPKFEGQFTIELTIGGTAWFANVSAVATSDVKIGQAAPSASSRAMIEWTTLDGYTDASIQFFNKTTGARYSSGGATPTSQIDLDVVTALVVRPGAWNQTSQTTTLIPTAANYKAWFDGTPATWIGSGGVATLVKTPYTWQTSSGVFFVESQMTSSGSVVDNYISQKQIYTIKLNNNNPPTTAKSYVLTLPPIVFPTGTTNPETIVELATYSGSVAGAYASEDAATPVFLPHNYILVGGNGTWTLNGVARQKTFATNTTTLTFSSLNDSVYPTNVPEWSPFEAVQTANVSGTIDRNGPWRDGQRLPESNTNFLMTYLNSLTRTNFGIPNTTDYVVTWIGIDSVSSDQVMTWIESNTVKPAVSYGGETTANIIYPSNAVVETLDAGVYKFSAVPIYARLKPGANEKWTPKAHSGWMYDSAEEYYLYADPRTQVTTGASFNLIGQNRQGAPVTVSGLVSGTPKYNLRQVASFDQTAATPQYSLIHKQEMKGNATTTLYVGYDDIYGISVKNLTLDSVVSVVSTTSATNVVTLTAPSSRDYDYEVSYRVNKSFYVDNNYTVGATPTTKVVFDKTAAAAGYTSYSVTYEGSVYDSATPVDLPLNTMYTAMDEGFIYVDHTVHALGTVAVTFSPSRLSASTSDYGMLAVRTFDVNGNPKSNQVVNLYTNFGNIDKTTVTTDRDGFGYATLTSEAWDGSLTPTPATPPLTSAPPNTANGYQGKVIAESGAIEGSAAFRVDIPKPLTNRIFAVPRADSILADGQAINSIVGKLQTSVHAPVSGATVTWRKGRTVYAVLNAGAGTTTGTVVTDATGRFLIEPFLSAKEPGYWFVAVTNGTVGDIVSWYEYPNVNAALDPITNTPLANNQDATPYWQIPNHTYGSVFPVTYDEEDRLDTTNNATPQWVPPAWYAISRYRQYQMGLYGSAYYQVSATPTNQEYKEF